jgi:molybdopterin molybdotransferase
MTVARLLLVPVLTGLSGRGVDAGLAWSDQPLAAAAPPGTGRERFLCGATDGGAVRILERQSAGSQALLARADRLVRLPGSGPALPVGTPVATLRF